MSKSKNRRGWKIAGTIALHQELFGTNWPRSITSLASILLSLILLLILALADVEEISGDVRLDGEPLERGEVELDGDIEAGEGRAAIALPGAGTLRIFPHTTTSIRLAGLAC